jgi:hypothetical protein
VSGAARSLYAWSIYVAIVGVGFLLMPNVVLSMFQIEETDEVWIRVLGLLVLGLPILYIAAARSERTGIYLASVWYRWFIAAGLILIGLVEGPWQLMLFASLDFLGGLWTFLAVRYEAEPDTGA